VESSVCARLTNIVCTSSKHARRDSASQATQAHHLRKHTPTPEFPATYERQCATAVTGQGAHKSKERKKSEEHRR